MLEAAWVSFHSRNQCSECQL